jgi:hypothetical protein
MKKINSNEFVELLSKDLGGNDLLIGNISISGKRIGSKIVFIDCLFDNDVSFKDYQFSDSLIFESCRFEGKFIISKTSFEKELHFNNCTISDSLEIYSCNFRRLKFDEGDINELYFSGPISQIPDSNITFEKGKFKKIKIEANEFGSELEVKSITANEIFISGTEFKKNVTFDSEELLINLLAIEKCNFNKRIDFKCGTISEFLDFRKSSFHDTALFYTEFNINQLFLNNIFSEHSFTINYFNNISSISISSCNFGDEFLCQKGYDKEKTNDDLSISLDGILKGKLIFADFSISHLDVSGTNLGIILINNVDVWNFTAVSFFNINSFIINNLGANSPNSFFVISESNVGKMELLNTNLKMFNEVIISSSNVSEIVLSNSALPEIIQIASKNPRIGYGPSKGSQLAESSFFRETYRQLRIAVEKQGNQNLALRYKSKEFYYLRKELPFGWDKVLLYINYISNNHGISWSRGILFTLSITFLFFIAYNQTLSDKYFFWTFDLSFKDFYKAFSIGLDGYVDFLSSFPKIVLNEEKLSNTSSKIIVFLARIFMGYGIYQTISAFRKYGKG